MIFQNHNIPPAAFLNLKYYDQDRQRAFMVASDYIASESLKVK